MTPASILESTSFSIERPPVPVAWKTSGSHSAAISLDTACTQGVVTPNIVSPTAAFPQRGLPVAGSVRPAGPSPFRPSPRAPFPRTLREIRLRTLHVGHGVHHRDVGRPDIGGDVAEATVEIITFGTPTGSACMPAVAIAVFPEPPAD
jgi:hypothetical protein